LDPTGVNPDNFINGEIKALSTSQVRAVAPAYGPFFTDSVVVYDHGNGRLLVHGDDYRIVDLLQSATLKFGLEIAQVILITNTNVSSSVRLNYQALGGQYQNNAEGLTNIYETFMADGRPVDWAEVLNKPTQYTPTLHTHLLEDLYGFEPVVVELERVRNAIVLSNVPAFEALIEWVQNNAGNTIITDPPLPFVEKNDTKVIRVFTTNNRNTARYYWSIEHVTTNAAHFVQTQGMFSVFQNRSQFTLQMSAVTPPANRKFNIVIRKDRVDGPISTTIEGITYLPENGDGNSVINLINACCVMTPGITMTPMAYFLAGE
jgi:hypothetical protein